MHAITGMSASAYSHTGASTCTPALLQEYLPVYEDPNMPPPDDPALHTWGQAAEPPEQAGEPQPLGTEVEGAAGQQGWVQPPWEAGADNPDHQEWEAGTGGDGGGGSQEAAEGERVLPARAPGTEEGGWAPATRCGLAWLCRALFPLVPAFGGTQCVVWTHILEGPLLPWV